jgi:hypothetical protein
MLWNLAVTEQDVLMKAMGHIDLPSLPRRVSTSIIVRLFFARIAIASCLNRSKPEMKEK